MISSVFIAGTDTEIGKTTVTCGLLDALDRRGTTCVGMKPIAAGAETTRNGLRNEDALALIEHSNRQLNYEIINPEIYTDPTSPNIAAARVNGSVSLARIVEAYEQCRHAADIVLVEGIGGWRVPLSNELQTVDMVRELGLGVVLVCGIRLGCINHALLTAEAISHDSLPIHGWIANMIDPDYDYAMETIDTINARIGARLLGTLPPLTCENRQETAQLFNAIAGNLWPVASPA